MDAVAYQDFVLEIVRRTDKEPGFKVLPRRWVVERTFGWMTRWKRLIRDYEQRIDVSEAMIHVALGSPMLRRIAPLSMLKRTLRGLRGRGIQAPYPAKPAKCTWFDRAPTMVRAVRYVDRHIPIE
jgi:hypothetical protein